MNESFDYVALVEQHLADEGLAKRLQQQDYESAGVSERREVVHRPLEVINDDRNARNIAPSRWRNIGHGRWRNIAAGGGGIDHTFDELEGEFAHDGVHKVTMHQPQNHRGLSLQELRNLPKSKPTQFQKEHKSCSICMDNFCEEEILTLTCFHIFHYKCVKTWFEKDHHCPECRADARKFSFS